MATRKVTTPRKRKFADPLEPPVIFKYRGMNFIKDVQKGISIADAFKTADSMIANGISIRGAIFVVNESPVPLT